ncbi:hypothetical protein [Nitratireductor sp. XY-223]|uniref:hypothetical protein n=1 Tax=Nitratireductor sp. XY-223 TaxID=2561926 RepID=UPI0010AB138D|nr:hypothetical protein [Nitratireductor sp. XY-223]
MRNWLFSVLVMLWAVCAQADVIPGTQYDHGVWIGAAYTSATTGKFDHCAVSAKFRSGDRLYLSLNFDSTLTVGITNSSFRFTAGESFPIVLSVDNRKLFGGRAMARSETFLIVTFEEIEALIPALKRGSQMRLESDPVKGIYSLRGSSRALDATLKCAIDNSDYAEKPADTAPLFDKSLLYQIATGMIAEVGATDFVYLTDKEVEELGFVGAVVWKSVSAGVVGVVLLTPAGEGEELHDSDSADIEELTRGCSGDVLSGIRSVKSSDLPTREIRVICTDEKIVEETIASKVLLDGAVLYTMLVFLDRVDDPALDGRDRIQLSDDIRLRAASFVRSEGR